MCKIQVVFITLALVTGAGCSKCQGQTLLEEHFDSAESLTEWGQMVGASSGAAVAVESQFSWDAGALRLSGDASTTSWTALTREIVVPDDSWVHIIARIRTEGVTQSDAHYTNCNIFLRHGGTRPSIDITQPLVGTNDWTIVERWIQVSLGGENATVGLLLSMPGYAWFDDIVIETGDPWSVEESGHYQYYTLLGDEVSDEAQAFNEESYRLIADYLGVSHVQNIDFYKYPDLDAITVFTGVRGNARRSGDTIHSIWATDRHEIVHILADAWGDPPALLAEGLAVFLSGAWHGRPVPEAAAQVLAAGDWVGLQHILTSAQLRGHPDMRTYPIAGAFVAWLDSELGRDGLRDMYGVLSNRSAAAEIRAQLEETLGGSVEEIDQRLRDWLSTQGR